jgi:AAA domain
VVSTDPNPPVHGHAAWLAAVDDADQHHQLTTVEGWRQFVADAPRPPELLPANQWERLQGAERLADTDARLDYHTRLGVVATSALRQVVHTGRRLMLLNRHAISARRGLIVSGAAGTGKTTAITQLGKTYELIDRQRHPGPGTERIPVVYVTVPPAATPRMLAVEFARFLGLPITTRANITDVIEAVCGVCLDTHTALVLVDEIHNLQLSTRNGAEVSDTLKYFSERIPATFVYSGVDVDRAGLFTGTRGQQLAGRFGLIPTLAFPYQTEWQGLVATLEDALRLYRHRPGTLARLDRYLHQRTGGMIGSLSHLLRGAAIEAILAGSEQLTRHTLDDVGLDHAAHRRHHAAGGRRQPAHS